MIERTDWKDAPVTLVNRVGEKFVYPSYRELIKVLSARKDGIEKLINYNFHETDFTKHELFGYNYKRVINYEFIIRSNTGHRIFNSQIIEDVMIARKQRRKNLYEEIRQRDVRKKANVTKAKNRQRHRENTVSWRTITAGERLY